MCRMSLLGVFVKSFSMKHDAKILSVTFNEVVSDCISSISFNSVHFLKKNSIFHWALVRISVFQNKGSAYIFSTWEFTFSLAPQTISVFVKYRFIFMARNKPISVMFVTFGNNNYWKLVYNKDRIKTHQLIFQKVAIFLVLAVSTLYKLNCYEIYLSLVS